jgi:serine protease AprX
MVEQFDASLRSTNWGKVIPLLVVAALLMPVFVATPKVDASPRVQPELLSLAAHNPGASFGVIVQKLVHDGSVEQAVARMGGTVTKDLSIINAFAASVPARSVQELSTTAGVRWVSMDAAVVKSVNNVTPINTANLQDVYAQSVQADRLWNTAPVLLQGQGVGVAVLDSGVNALPDLRFPNGSSRVVAQVKYNRETNSMSDQYGHGTHIAGIIGGNGSRSSGGHVGIAPSVNLISVKISDDEGASTTSDVVAGLAWVLFNKNYYNIRVVNISFNSTVAQSYNVDPIDAAVEVLWVNRIVVVASAGNNGAGTLYAPANDPFVITVGAANDNGTADISDDTVPAFSASGVTQDGFSKPDLVAPGMNMVSLLSRSDATLAEDHPANRVNNDYFRMSGTSMAAPVVAGVAALLLQDEPTLNPDQVKYRLKATATANLLDWPGYNPARAGAGYVNAYAAVNGATTLSANTGTPFTRLLGGGINPPVWNSVNWSSVNWSSVNWSSVNWSSVNWSSDYWGNE